ncbi:M28 family metallopeptidase [Hirschia baltica]|uniref:Fibronectin type III domain protein n=1 Tax=Hirschia baltica (strain ATCC 49814 / DSM 5838 / IFAM 1418) TaxID=582402 RepID=C6XNT2_HIRBI|nr:M28 family metallopeptidase [Hirschia baltica]ACT58335.1 Fibronectin type III domain protein [Hirschia baltica ATCC 49814]
MRILPVLLMGVLLPSHVFAAPENNQEKSVVPAAEYVATHDMVATTSAERIEHDIRKLAGFGTRHTLSDTKSETRGIGAARRWIEEEFKTISKGCKQELEVVTVSDIVRPDFRIPEDTEIVNVVAIQRGVTDPDRVVIMSGDIDSRISDVMNFTDDSPGANDNASGMAGTMEAARVMCQHEFAGTVVYAGLSGEEQGLFGGKILAEYAIENGWKVKAILNNDMIGNIEGVDGVIDNSTARVFSEGTLVDETAEEARYRRFRGGEVDSASRNLARYVDKMADLFIPNLDVMMIYRLDRFGRGGHHRPFNDFRIPGVRIMETHENYNRQHQDLRVEDGIEYGDVVEGVDFDYAAKLTSLNIATLANLAAAPPFPSNVKVEGAVQPDTTLSWDQAIGDEAANLAGYKVYWRLTDQSQWQWSKFVGNVDNYTLKGVVIDNYLFGVASVSKDGAESAVVFPGYSGSFGE